MLVNVLTSLDRDDRSGRVPNSPGRRDTSDDRSSDGGNELAEVLGKAPRFHGARHKQTFAGSAAYPEYGPKRKFISDTA